MVKLYNNKTSRYALIICLGVALLFVQTFKLHWHIQHDGISSSATAGHIVDVHVASSLHDAMYDTHHQNDAQGHHHTAEIDVSSSSFVKKTGLLNLLILLFSITSIILCVPRLRRICCWYVLKTKLPALDYLLHPPLRAPPA